MQDDRRSSAHKENLIVPVIGRADLEAENERLREALREARQWCIDGKDAIEPRNVLGQVVAVVGRALGDAR